jgi:CheY-like chemotaxis protein
MKVLVIDDQEWRKEFYMNLENLKSGFDFSLNFLSESEVASIDRVFLSLYDLVLLDVVLESEWSISSTHVARMIRECDKDIPIVLITGNWTATNHSEIEGIVSLFNAHKAPLPFYDFLTKEQFENLKEKPINELDYKGIKDSNIGYIARTLKMITKDFRRKHDLDKGENDSIFILHISDIQMGGEQGKNTKLEPSTIAQFVVNTFGVPDFLAITGDISENGQENEFIEAHDWIEGICRVFNWSVPFDRVMVIPGNHDVYAPVFGLCRTAYQRSTNSTPGTFVVTEDVANNQIAAKLAFVHFQQFAYRLTGKKHWLINGAKYWTDNRFEAEGIRFIGLNTVANVTYNSPFVGHLSAHDYEEIRKTISSDMKAKGSLMLALAHHPNIDQNQLYRTFSETSPSPDILLTGHLHKADFSYIRQLNQLRFGAPTSTLKESLRSSDVSRGFSIIELKRNLRVVNQVVNHSYIRSDGRWINDEKICFKRINEKWQEDVHI